MLTAIRVALVRAAVRVAIVDDDEIATLELSLVQQSVSIVAVLFHVLGTHDVTLVVLGLAPTVFLSHNKHT